MRPFGILHVCLIFSERELMFPLMLCLSSVWLRATENGDQRSPMGSRGTGIKLYFTLLLLLIDLISVVVVYIYFVKLMSVFMHDTKMT